MCSAALLLLAAGSLAAVLEAIGMPAGLLLGPMIAAIGFAARGGRLRLPPLLAMAAQALIGLMIAPSLNLASLAMVGDAPAIFLGTTAATLAAALGIAWLAGRLKLLPGPVAIWGLMPGAATAMVLMARDEKADWQLVAVMAYTRVILVAAIASLLALAVSGKFGSAPPGGAWFPVLEPWHLAETIIVGTIGVWCARRLRLSAAALLGPMFLGAMVGEIGLAQPQLPGWLLALAYLTVGLRIGLGFTPDIIAAARRAAPWLLAAVGSLIVFCAACGFVLSCLSSVDPLTAYLATSPGGADFVAIIATAADVDVSFVMAMQVTRLLAVIVLGPVLARRITQQLRTRGKVPAGICDKSDRHASEASDRLIT